MSDLSGRRVRVRDLSGLLGSSFWFPFLFLPFCRSVSVRSLLFVGPARCWPISSSPSRHPASLARTHAFHFHFLLAMCPTSICHTRERELECPPGLHRMLALLSPSVIPRSLTFALVSIFVFVFVSVAILPSISLARSSISITISISICSITVNPHTHPHIHIHIPMSCCCRSSSTGLDLIRICPLS